MEILLLGSTGRLGSCLLSEFKERGDTVYEVQRNPSIDVGNWIQCDFSMPADLVFVVQKVLARAKKFDVIINACSLKQAKPAKDITEFTLQEHLRVNVLSPLFLSYYLYLYDCTTATTRTVFFLDDSNIASGEYFAYFYSKAMLISTVDFFYKHLRVPLKACFVLPNDNPTINATVLRDFLDQPHKKTVDLRYAKSS